MPLSAASAIGVARTTLRTSMPVMLRDFPAVAQTRKARIARPIIAVRIVLTLLNSRTSSAMAAIRMMAPRIHSAAAVGISRSGAAMVRPPRWLGGTNGEGGASGARGGGEVTGAR